MERLSAAPFTSEAVTEDLRRAASRLSDLGAPTPRVAVLLEGARAETFVAAAELDLGLRVTVEEITAEGELGLRPGGELILGGLAGVPVAAWGAPRSRFEGSSCADLAFVVRLLRLAGAGVLLTTGSCGALDPLWRPGEVVLVDDHINLTGENPLTGSNLSAFGCRFPDLSATYDETLRAMAEAAALAEGAAPRRGVYVALPGPNLETRAEYRMLRWLGGDVVGTGVAPEAIVARHAGMRVLALTVVTDRCLAEGPESVPPEKDRGGIWDVAPGLGAILRGVVAGLG